LIALFFAFFILGEKIYAMQLLGGAFTLSGIALMRKA
jgi:drug/metabolite transporter (DMT)-like permease